MTIRQILFTSAVVLAVAVPAAAQDPDPAPAAEARAQARAAAQAEAAAARAEAAKQRAEGRANGGNFKFIVTPFGPMDVDAIYDSARQAIENSQFDRAIRDLDRVLADQGRVRADAALYWKAYSQSRIAETQEALKTLNELMKEFAKSTWAKDAKALAVEIQAANGQPISADLQGDEELKLLALRGVMQSDPERGVPIIEKMLAGGASPRVRERALFVLSQSRSPRAREVMLNTARNNGNPDLQLSAIRYLGMMGGADDREALNTIYRSATDMSVKRAIISSYFTSGNVDRMIDIAKTEKDSGAAADCHPESRLDEPLERREHVRRARVIYKSDNSSDTRRQIVNSLFIQRNAKALVELARSEKDPDMKRELVSKLSVMKTPEATDYMLELLK